MSNLKKAVQKLSEKLNVMTNNEADQYMNKILRSYELLISYRANSKKEAFINSVYTYSNEDKYAEEIKKHKTQIKSNKSEKYRLALHYEDVIKNQRQLAISYQNIAANLNAHFVHRAKFFSAKFIERFCKENNIVKRLNDVE